MKEAFVKPVLEIIMFETEDVVLVSPPQPATERNELPGIED